MKRLLAALLFIATPAAAADLSREAQVGAAMEKLRADPAALRVFLQDMPKGGDLHNHLDGSVWAEDFLKWADADGWCIDKASHALAPPPCTAQQVPAKGLIDRDVKFYEATIDALSVRNFVPGTGTGETSGHDHTFAAFPRFGAIMGGHLGDALAVTRAQAAGDHVQYVEQITDPGGAFAPALLGGIGQFDAKRFDADLKQVSAQLPALVRSARAEYDAAEHQRDILQHCAGGSPDPACAVKTRYLFFVLRTFQPAQVFAQAALGFALAAADPRFVGINLVAPEDDPVALRDFDLHMRIFQYFHRKYPKVKISLHAGELWLGLVPPSELGFHIRDSIEIAGASRIGHGYEMPFERDAPGLLAEMAKNHVAVEINLTSNDISPGVKGAEHPLHLYRKAGVPFTLSADDEGVFRIDLTHDYVRAALEQHLTYTDLKTAARNGIQYSFLPGQSLWQQGSELQPVAACAKSGAACDVYLANNEKAAAQFALERSFDHFEADALPHSGGR
jgi:adenosine deaminase